MAQNISTNKDVALAVREKLAEVGGLAQSHESTERSLRTHPETFYLRPDTRSNREAAELYTAAAKDEEEVEATTKIFEYRPLDGAHAVTKTLRDLYGHPGFGKSSIDMFGGVHPPQKMSVNTGIDTSVEVPWGDLEVPWGEGASIVVGISAVRDREKGSLSMISITHKKKYAASVKGLLKAIETTLQDHSIYRGKAFTGAAEPEFLDLSKVDGAHIAFSNGVQEALERELWGSITRRELYKAAGRPTRWNCLFVGDYGSGKTLATILTAQRCAAQGITFIQARPGQDDLNSVMQMANLYAPAIVAFEDVDRVADPTKATGSEISALLEAFDGMRSKSSDVSVILTTNFPERIDPGLLRAGRIQGYYEFGPLDASALGKLITAKLGETTIQDLDETVVYDACHGYSPAFMDLVIEVSRSYALSRHADALDSYGDGGWTQEDYLNYRVNTDDLVAAANRLRPQYNRQEAAKQTTELPTFDKVFRQAVAEAVDLTKIVDEDGDSFTSLQHPNVKR